MLDRYPLLKNLTLRQWLGWILILLSCLGWAALPVVPFLPIDLSAKAAWTAGLLVFAEVAWWAAMPLLGPEIVALLKNFWSRCKSWFKRLFGRQ